MGDFFLRPRSRGNDKRRLIADDDLEGAEAGGNTLNAGYGAVPNLKGRSLVIYFFYSQM